MPPAPLGPTGVETVPFPLIGVGTLTTVVVTGLLLVMVVTAAEVTAALLVSTGPGPRGRVEVAVGTVVGAATEMVRVTPAEAQVD